jgi:general stress protein 26
MVPPTSLLVELLTHRKSIEKGWFNPQKRWFNEIDRPLPDFFLMATNLGSKLTINVETYWLIAGEGP